MRIGLLAISGWLVAAVLTVGISWSAISVVRSSVVAQPSVVTAPAEASTGPATTRSPDQHPPHRHRRRVAARRGQGGSATVRCVNGRPTSSTPRRTGFPAELDDSGNEVQFRSSDHRTQITVTCTGNTAHPQVEEKPSVAGGGGDDGDGGGSGVGGSGSAAAVGGAAGTPRGQPPANSEAPVGQVEDRLRHDAEDDRRGHADPQRGHRQRRRQRDRRAVRRRLGEVHEHDDPHVEERGDRARRSARSTTSGAATV